MAWREPRASRAVWVDTVTSQGFDSPSRPPSGHFGISLGEHARIAAGFRGGAAVYPSRTENTRRVFPPVRRTAQLFALLLLVLTVAAPAPGQKSEVTAAVEVREELWGIPSIIPMLAYLARPVGDGPFPLLVMNHGVALDPKERRYFPVIEFRDAALWFAKQGYVVVAPIRPGYGAAAIENPERGLFGLFFSWL